MSLSKAEIVAREIRELVRLGKRGGEAKQLAEKFSKLRTEANRRLDQCLAMLGADDKAGAIAQALHDPPILELARALEFDDEQAWQQICAEEGYPLAPGLDNNAIAIISNALENQGEIGPGHPLFRKFNKKMAARDVEGAYEILQEILSMDPGNRSARKAKPELEENLLQKNAILLAEAVQANDIMGTTMLVEKLERLGFSGTSRIECWEKAKRIQSTALVQKIQQSYQDGEWQDCVQWLKDLEAIYMEFPGIQPDAVIQIAMGPIEEWAEKSERDWEQDRVYRESVGKLEEFLSQRPANGRWGSGMPLVKVKELVTTLEQLIANVESKGQPIPESMKDRMEAALEEARDELVALRREVTRKAVTRKTLIASGLGVLIFAIVCVYSLFSGRSFLDRIEKDNLIEGRKVTEMERELAGQYFVWLKEWIVPSFKEKVLEAQNKVATENESRDKVGKKIKAVEEAVQKGSQVELGILISLAHDLKNIGNEDSDLAEEFVREFSPRINKIKTNLKKREPDFVKYRDELLDALENITGGLRPGVGADNLEKKLAECVKFLDQWERCADPAVGFPEPLVEQRNRYDDLSGPVGGVDEWRQKLKEYRSVIGTDIPSSVRERSLGKYLDSLNFLRDSGVAEEPQRSAAKKMFSLVDTPSVTPAKAMLSDLYRPEWAGNYSNFLDKLELQFSDIPAFVDPRSLKIFNNLRFDDFLANVEVFAMSIDSDSTPAIAYVRFWVAEPHLAANIFGKQVQFHDFFGIKGSHGEVKRPYTFSKNIILNKTVSFEMNQNRVLKGCKVYSLYDPKNGQWGNVKGLEVLELLNKHGKTNVKYLNEMFLAYVTYQVYEILSKTPSDWGLMWSPHATRQHKKLKDDYKMKDAEVGDWMIYDKCKEHAKYVEDPLPDWLINKRSELQAHFIKAAGVSYLEEAEAYHKLLQWVYSTGRKYEFIGYKEPGKPSLPQAKGKPAGYVIGYHAKGNKLGAIIQVDGKGNPKLLDEALDYSPLLFIRKEDVPAPDQAGWAEFIMKMKGKHAPKVDLPKIFNLP